MMNKKLITCFEITLLLFSIFAFSYSISKVELPVVITENSSEKNFFQKFFDYVAKPIFQTVSANPFFSSGCCLEDKNGAVCQEMNLLDSNFCKTDLLGESCSLVDECQPGCCYSGESGLCSLNAPKDKCELSGGSWNSDASCKIAECQMGCCVLGSSISMTTSQECGILSSENKLQKDFRSLDEKGTCAIYEGLSNEGACLTGSSLEKSCTLTTKDKCSGEFKQGALCTSKELKTSCQKTTQTSCMDEKVYFLDSCGNKANIYDEKKANDDSYWEKIISKESSCKAGDLTCGNCDYSQGSICSSETLSQKPKYGDFICKNLNCAGGKNNGESWCVSDYDNSKLANAPVGARNYIAKCIEGEISIEGCADFNQEICIQSESKNSQAKCMPNDWRSCLAVNEKTDYDEIEKECNDLPQCVMFLDIPGNEKYLGLPGFKDSGINDDQGRAGEVGKDLNKVIGHCVPKYTPGLQFWSDTSNLFASSADQQETQKRDYGGSKEESDAICSLGSFTCVSHIQTDSPLVDPDKKDKENPECNIDAVNQGNQQVDLFMQALNERCRSLGPCGTTLNIAGEQGQDEGYTITRTYINKKGKSSNASLEEYILSPEYLGSLSGKIGAVQLGSIEKLSQLSSISSGTTLQLLFASLLTGKAVETAQPKEESSSDQIVGVIGAATAVAQLMPQTSTLAASSGSLSSAGVSASSASSFSGVIGASSGETLTFTEVGGSVQTTGTVGGGEAFISGATPTTGSGTPTAATGGAGTVLSAAAIGAIAGQLLGKTIAKSSGMSPGESEAFTNVMMGLGAAAGAAAGTYIATGAAVCTGGVTCIVGLGIIIVGVIYAAITAFSGEDHEYYVLEYKCEAWQPPKDGNCEVCNSDVRPCSEYKCRSLGSNCRYFTDNGEPGQCSSISEIWQATIKPWNEILSEGNKYASVGQAGFEIQGKSKITLEPWEQLTFGIITDKQAICKIGFESSVDFDKMQYQMVSEINPENGKLDGLHHKIVLSPNVKYEKISNYVSVETTLPMKTGENNYYIKCKNFAGQTNDASFVVKLKLGEGPDLMAPRILRTTPLQNSFLKKDSNMTNLFVYLNEPAECKYSKDYDMDFDQMNKTLSCETGLSSNGEWACFTQVNDLTLKNKLFIRCIDQPDLQETDLIKRNVNLVGYEYNFNVCQEGLKLNILNPTNLTLIDSKNKTSFYLEATTSGCNAGNAVCSFKFNEGNNFIKFSQTGNRTHKQLFSNLQNGNYSVEVSCIDNSGNQVKEKVGFVVNLDEVSPQISRAYYSGKNLILKTNEPSECNFVLNNGSNSCDFSFIDSFNYLSETHTLTGAKEGTYYVKCRDSKNNQPTTCSATIKLLLS